MHLITFQDKKVWDCFYELEKNVFENNSITMIDSQLLTLTTQYLKNKLNIPSNRFFYPIWAWVIKDSKQIDDELIENLINLSKPSCDRITMFELNVPNDFCTLMNFNVWEDLYFQRTFYNKDITDDDFSKLFEKKKGATLQCVLPLISKSWIKSVQILDKVFNEHDFIETNNIIKNMIKKGEIKLNEEGMIESYENNI